LKKKILFIIISLSLIIGITYFIHKPNSTENYYGSYDVSKMPEQNDLSDQEEIIIKIRKGELKLKLIAEYKIKAKVLSKKKYYDSWTSKISPYDLALGWGKLVDKNLKNKIKYSQSMRFYFYRYKNIPFNPNYIIEHSANTHIIPATKNLKKALKFVRKNSLLIMEGYLVDVDGVYKKSKVWWHTSKVRTDSGNGACEVFYLKKLKLGNKVYE